MASTAARRTEENKRIARRIPEDVATDRRLDLFEELVTENYIEHGPFGMETQGVTASREALGSFLDAFPDFEAEVEEIVAEGALVAMRVTLRGTHDGEFMGFEPTGESFEVQNMVFTRIENGRIAERWVQPDTLSMMQQLGLDNVPGENQ